MNEPVEVRWSPLNQKDLLWWSDLSSLLQGISLEEVQPDLLFWSDASDQGRVAHPCDQFISGLWFPAERFLSVSLWELCSIRLGLLHFRHLLRDLVDGVFTDNTIALSHVRKRGNVLHSI